MADWQDSIRVKGIRIDIDSFKVPGKIEANASCPVVGCSYIGTSSSSSRQIAVNHMHVVFGNHFKKHNI